MQKDLHSKSSYHLLSYKVTNIFPPLVMRTFKIYFPTNFQICNTAPLTILHAIHSIPTI